MNQKLNNFISLFAIILGLFLIIWGMSYFAIPLILILLGIAAMGYGFKLRGGVYRSAMVFMSNFSKFQKR
ncbi:hypothetical protein M1446_00825 [Candidatus Dependentiae bacterium]|nr:hypothetical protein [Candidatus Dependentiae bacterium]